MFILCMEELKTLKDIFDEQLLSEHGLTGVRDDLKQEAIKWMNIGGSFDRFIIENYETHREEDAIYCFIEHFFNITEEDLNNQKEVKNE